MGWSIGVEIMNKQVEALYRAMGFGRYPFSWWKRVWWLICDLAMDMRGLLKWK